jgi:hypothetical protein
MHRTDKSVADFFDAGLLKLKLIKAKPFSMAEDCNAVSLCEISQGTETRFRFSACMGIMVESVSRTPTALRGLRDFEWVSVRLPRRQFATAEKAALWPAGIVYPML